MSKLQTALINFQHTQLLTSKDEEGKVFIALKPLIVDMGLDWRSQYAKIMADTRYGVITIPYQTNGGVQEMLSLSLDHLPAFLYSINPNRVRKDLRETIIAFQSETFAVINAYWRNPTLEPELETHEGKSLLCIINGYKGKLTVMQNEVNRLRYDLKVSRENENKGLWDDAQQFQSKELALLKKENLNLKQALHKSKTVVSAEYIPNMVHEFEATPIPNGVHPKLYANGVIPIFRERLKALGERIERELGTVGKPYMFEVQRLGLFFTEPERYNVSTVFGLDIFREQIKTGTKPLYDGFWIKDRMLDNPTH